MEPIQERDEKPYSGLSQAQQKRANLNRILMAKSELPADAVFLYNIFITRQSAPSQRRGCLPNGGSCPSTQSLQKRMGNSKSRFYHALNILQYLGLVKVQSGKGSGKGGRNVYIAKWWHEWPENTIHCFQASADYAKRGTRL